MIGYDVIVVGAGNGGLVAAATVAKAGYKTLLLEQHNLPGGCATSFVRGRFEFETALHELLSESTSPRADSANKIFARLGMDAPFAREDTLFRAIVKGENGYDVTLKAGYDAFLDSMEAAVPGCRESVKRLLDLETPLDNVQDALDSGDMDVKSLSKEVGTFLRVATHKMDEVMDAVGVPEKARRILSTYWGYLGVPTDDINALHYLSLLASYVVNPPTMPLHRSHAVSQSLARVFTDAGGEIRYNTKVDRFLYGDGNKVIGVTAGKEVFYGRRVISNIIPDAVWSMSDPERVPKRAKKLAGARKLGMTFITAYLGLDASMEELGIKDYSVFIMNDPDTRRQFDDRMNYGMYVVNCLNKVIPDSSPAGTCTLFFTLPLMPGDLPEDLSPENYEKFKNDFVARYIDDYEKTLGVRIRPHIEEIAVATPVTFARYLGTPDGCIYGYASEGWDNVVARTVMQGMENRIPNLYFCGGHGIRGDGYSSAYFTGAATAAEVIKSLEKGGDEECKKSYRP